MTTTAIVYGGVVMALTVLSGIAVSQEGGAAADAIASAMPIPERRILLPQIALWMVSVVGFAYLVHLRVRTIRTSVAMSMIVRAGSLPRLAARGTATALGWSVVHAALIIGGSLGGYVAGGGRSPGTGNHLLPGFGVWAAELAVCVMALSAAAWAAPGRIAGVVTAIGLTLLGGIQWQQRWWAITVAGVLVGAALILTLRKTDWTVR